MEFVKSVFIEDYAELVGQTVVDSESKTYFLKEYKNGVFLALSDKEYSLLTTYDVSYMTVFHALEQYTINIKEDDGCPCGCDETYRYGR